MSKESEFLDLIERHRGVLIKISRLYFNNHDDRDELVQEMVLQLWQSLDSFKQNSQFSTWMYRVAINTAIVFVKKDRKRKELGSIDEIRPAAAPSSDESEVQPQLEIFYQAIQTLSRIEKAVVLMNMDGMSHREIAETLGISEGNARVKLNRTKKKIKSAIREMGHEI